MHETATIHPDVLAGKETKLKALLQGYESLAIAYSGGADSAYLADVAHEVLGDAARIVLADSPSIPRSEVAEASAVAAERGWNFEIIETEEFDNEAYLKNDGTRCFHCRSELFAKLDVLARTLQIKVIAYGENADDRQDPTRLGAIAAKEYRVVAPLAEVPLHKEEIRALSQQRQLATWDKPSFACLSSRFPVGTRVEIEALQKVEAAEEILKAAGFAQYRARHHGELLRIEVSQEDLPRFAERTLREQLVASFQSIGYRHITLDLAGYRSGSTAT
jgi:uncharacterized protein